MVPKILDIIEKSICSLPLKSKRRHSKALSVRGPGVFFVGEDLDSESPTEIFLSESDRARSVYITGSIGCGKTNLNLRLIQNDLIAGKTLILIDLRGDLVDKILAMLVAMGREPDDRVCLIDLCKTKHITGFNPLSGEGSTHSRALHVLHVVRRQAESWGVQLDDTLRNCLIALTEAGCSLAEVATLLNDSAFRERVHARVLDPYASAFLSLYSDLSPERQKTLSLPVLNKITPFLCVPVVRRTLGSRSSIDLKKLIDTPGQVVLLSLAVDKLHGAARLLGSLFVSCLQNAVMSRTGASENKRNPVSLYIDEFENFASHSFESIVAEGRRFKLSLTLSHQNLSQLPTGLRQVLRNNVATQLYFQTGSIDAAELSKEVIGLGSKEEVKRLLQTQKVGEAILTRRGQRPVHLKTPLFSESKVSQSSVNKFRDAVLATCAMTSNSVDAEMRNRLCRSKGSNNSSEVRHDRPPTNLKRRTK